MKRILGWLLLVGSLVCPPLQAAELPDFGYGKHAWQGENPLPVLVIMVRFADAGFLPYQTREHYRRLFFGNKPSIRDYFETVSNGQFSIVEAGIIEVLNPDFVETNGDEQLLACGYGRKSTDADNDNRLDTYSDSELPPPDASRSFYGYPDPENVCGQWYWNEGSNRWQNVTEAARLQRILRRIAAWGAFDFSAYDANGDGRLTSDELAIVMISPPPLITRRAEPYGWAGGYRSLFNGLNVAGVRIDAGFGFIFMDSEIGVGTVAHEIFHFLGVGGAKDVYSSGTGRCLNYRYSIMSCTGHYVEIDRKILFADSYHAMVRGWLAPELKPISTLTDQCILLPAMSSQLVGPDAGLPKAHLFYDDTRFRADGGVDYFLVENRLALEGTYDGDVPVSVEEFPDPTDQTMYSFTSHLGREGVIVWHVDVDAEGRVYRVDRFDESPVDSATTDYSFHTVAFDRSLIPAGSDSVDLNSYQSWGVFGSTTAPTLMPGLRHLLYWPELADTNDDDRKGVVGVTSSGVWIRPLATDPRGVAYLAVGPNATADTCNIPDDVLMLKRDVLTDTGIRVMLWEHPFRGYRIMLEIEPGYEKIDPQINPTIQLRWYAYRNSNNYQFDPGAIRLMTRRRLLTYPGNWVEEPIALTPVDYLPPPASGPTQLQPQVVQDVSLDSILGMEFNYEVTVTQHPGDSNSHRLARLNIELVNPLKDALEADYRDDIDRAMNEIPLPPLEDEEPPPLPELLSPEEGALISTLEPVFQWRGFREAVTQNIRFNLCIAPEGGAFDCRAVNPPPAMSLGAAAFGAGGLLVVAGIGIGMSRRRRIGLVLLILGAGLIAGGCGGGGGGGGGQNPAPQTAVEVQEQVSGLTSGSYRWYVEAIDEAGNVSMSEVRTFKVEVP